MAKRYYNLENETKAYLKACDNSGIVNQTSISFLNEYVLSRKGRNLSASFLANNPIKLDNLVLWFDTSINEFWRDNTENNNHPILTNTSITNKSLEFTRNLNSRATITQLNLSNTNRFTCEFWVNFKSLPAVSGYSGDYGRIICELSDDFNVAVNNGFLISVEHELTGFRWMTGTRGSIGYNLKNLVTPLPLVNTWYNFVCVFDHTQAASNQRTFYINGVLQNNISSTGNGGRVFNAQNTNNFGNRIFRIGGRASNTSSQDMFLPVFKIYNTVLTPAEVLQNFNALRGRFGI